MGLRLRSLGSVTLAVVAVIAFTGCQTLTSKDARPVYSAAEQRARLSQLKYWQAEGKIAFSRGSERQSANFNWQQYNQNYSIHIFGPFGLGATWLKRSKQSVTLENAKIGTHSANSVEQLMESLVGWQVPISNMQYWIKGIAAPTNRPEQQTFGQPVTTAYDNGLVETLKQQGWTVNITQYKTEGRWRLPRKLIATREQLRLKVIIKRWQPRTNRFWR